MIIIKLLNYSIMMITVFLIFGFTNSQNAEAKVITVKDGEELDEVTKDLTEDTKVILDSNFDSKDHGIHIEYSSDFDLSIDGKNVPIYSGVEISDEGSGDLTIENIMIDGSLENEESEVLGVYFNGENEKGKTTIRNLVVKNLTNESSESIYFPYNGSEKTYHVDLENILVENNKKTELSGIIIEHNKFSANIKNSTFNNNMTEYGGAAIHSEGEGVKIEVSNSKFINNISSEKQENRGNNGAGAIFMSAEGNSSLIVKKSLFENNKADFSGQRDMPSSGAISFYTYNSGNFLEVSGSTFNSNEGDLGGGAIAVFEEVINVHAKVENSTFYKNKNNSGEDLRSAGGAISTHIYDDDQYGELDGENFASWNNTFLDNSVVKKDVTEIKGGAIGFENNIVENSLINNLFVGNKLENGEGNQKLFDNVFVYSKNIENIRNLGFDNGVQTKHTVASVYGKYPIKLENNDSTVKAGRKEDAKIIPTLRIAPDLKNFDGKQYVGIANMRGTLAPETDQQGNKRLGSPDIGAIEISSLVYDANQGNFTLSELKSYDGKKYYEGKNPKQYAEVGIPGKKYSILDPKKILKPVRKNYTFLGWSDDADVSKANPKYNTGKTIVVEDQEILYAVWQEKKFTLKYFSNGKTTGLIPTQMTAPSSTKLMIQSAAKMKRKGYKFKGWSTKPNAIKTDPKFAPGKKINLTKSIKLYAVWHR